MRIQAEPNSAGRGENKAAAVTADGGKMRARNDNDTLILIFMSWRTRSSIDASIPSPGTRNEQLHVTSFLQCLNQIVKYSAISTLEEPTQSRSIHS